jgi:hypothetical protein
MKSFKIRTSNIIHPCNFFLEREKRVALGQQKLRSFVPMLKVMYSIFAPPGCEKSGCQSNIQTPILASSFSLSLTSNPPKSLLQVNVFCFLVAKSQYSAFDLVKKRAGEANVGFCGHKVASTMRRKSYLVSTIRQPLLIKVTAKEGIIMFSR